MKNSRNKQFVSFKLYVVLSSMVDKIFYHPTQDVNLLCPVWPYCICYPTISLLETVLVIRSTVAVSKNNNNNNAGNFIKVYCYNCSTSLIIIISILLYFIYKLNFTIDMYV